ncbi:MAG: NUDIX domain-containing protein [Mangrovibacterium sp.]
MENPGSHTYRYPRPALTVDAIVFRKGTDHLLLIRRGKNPYAGKWALPGGFLEMGELLEEGCRRELEEETGLRPGPLKQFRTYDALDRDPRGRTISVVFYGTAEAEAVQGGDDADMAAWFPIGRLPELAFDHERIICDFLRYTGGKLPG